MAFSQQYVTVYFEILTTYQYPNRETVSVHFPEIAQLKQCHFVLNSC